MARTPVSTFTYASLPAATAEALRQQAERIRARVKATTEAIIDIGRDLLAVKQQLEHGQFSEWVTAECGFTLRTAENYIRAAEFAEGKNEIVSLLAPATVYKLSAKSAPQEIVNDVLDRAKNGLPIIARDVDSKLAKAALERRTDKLLAKKAARGKPVSSLAVARREKRREREEEESRRELERQRALAAQIIDRFGERDARYLIDVLDNWRNPRVLTYVREQLFRKVS